MGFNKLNSLIETYNLTNIIKILIILIILLIIARIFIPSTNILSSSTKTSIVEGFSGKLSNGIIYGNVISLKNSQNIPAYFANTCTLALDNNYRIDTLIFKFNATISNSINYDTSKNIYIQYQDGNGNLRNIKSAALTDNSSPPDFKSIVSNSILSLDHISDENGLAVYTSQIVLTIGGSDNLIDKYLLDTNGNGYIKEFGIYGGTRDLITLTDYNALSVSSAMQTVNIPLSKHTEGTPTNNSSTTFTTGDNFMIYAIKLGYNAFEYIQTETPFNITIKYENTLYTSNEFTIDNIYKVRSDINRVSTDANNTYIFLTEPIIANKITVIIDSVIISATPSSSLNININSLTALKKTPLAADIASYKQTINLIQQESKDNSNGENICPSINALIDTQTKTQKICDNLEYQDKVKSEKLRLERNKQYLLKLKAQQEQVDQLNSVIQDLENKRQARAQSSDQVRVLQYQQQKADASTIRDLANQRIESQDNNKLYMNVNINGNNY